MKPKKKFFFEFFVLWVFLSFVRVAYVVESIEFLKVGSKMIVIDEYRIDICSHNIICNLGWGDEIFLFF